MGRLFAYCRVSTIDQTVDNQVLAIKNAGYDVEDHRIVSETVSGSVMARDRKGFADLIEHKLESGDTLIVLKLDRLGRDNIDVQQTVELLGESGINIICLDLPVQDLSKPEGKLMLQMMVSFAEFERNRIRERTKEGLERAKQEGIKLGRPQAVARTKEVQILKSKGLSQSKVAVELGVSVMTVKRHWNKSV